MTEEEIEGKMDFDSPEVMKDFPGLYMAEKRKGNDSDYNDESEKASKKEMMIGKRKEKKDKKDKDKGYAALEGESSDEASPCKAKKSKAFIFTSKSKDKEKELSKGESSLKVRNKKKVKLGFGSKLSADGANQNIAEALPIFGANLVDACERAKCHDGIALPLPVRECIDIVEAYGLNFENVYKVSGNKNKVNLIKKMYNSRQTVILSDYEVPTVTSVLKTFLRDLPEPIFTNELLTRFEEAAAIFNYNIREKHLKTLINSLPNENRLLLSWLIMHFHNIVQRDQVNKMNKQSLAQTLNHTLHTSSKLLQALITHRMGLFPEAEIIKYVPPLDGQSVYPEDLSMVESELHKVESLLNLIHWEMQQGFSSSWRQDQLWEVQRVQTDLKRKLKKELQQIATSEENDEPQEVIEDEDAPKGAQNVTEEDSESYTDESEENVEMGAAKSSESDHDVKDITERVCSITTNEPVESEEEVTQAACPVDIRLLTMQCQNKILTDLVENLTKSIHREYEEIDLYKQKLKEAPSTKKFQCVKLPRNFKQVRKLLVSENHMLEIKKVELVRQIVELTEQCVNMKARIMANESFN